MSARRRNVIPHPTLLVVHSSEEVEARFNQGLYQGDLEEILSPSVPPARDNVIAIWSHPRFTRMRRKA